jgi:hypothetical protein
MDGLLDPTASALERSGIPFQRGGERPWMKSAGIRRVLAGLGEHACTALPGALNAVLSGLCDAEKVPREDREILMREAEGFIGDPEGFVDHVVLGNQNEAVSKEVDRVSLLTLHASKGLEFSVVFILGCEDSLLPLALDAYRGDVEEERRLFYVGMTRARDMLFLCRAEKRMVFGRTLKNPESPFLKAIRRDLTRKASMKKGRRKRPRGRQLSLFE